MIEFGGSVQTVTRHHSSGDIQIVEADKVPDDCHHIPSLVCLCIKQIFCYKHIHNIHVELSPRRKLANTLNNSANYGVNQHR